MKKQLLAGTMLVAAGAIATSGAANAQTVNLELGGYMEQIFGVALDRGNPAEDPGLITSGGAPWGVTSSFDQQSESEVFFQGSGKLDNGIEIVAQMELEIAGSPGNPIDEQYMIVRGNFGQFTLGSEDNAGHLMTIGYQGSWATAVGQNSTFDTTDWIPLAAGMTAGGSRLDGTLADVRLRSGDNDSSKVSYFTPRFAGFQIGASYIPNFEQQTFATAGAGGSDDLPNKDTGNLTGYNEGWAAGVNFDRKFGGFGLGVALGYLTAKPPSHLTNGDDMSAYAAGLKVDFGPVRLAAGYKVNNDLFVNDGLSLEGSIWDVGARFTAGPNAFSVSYRSGEMDASVADPDDDEEQAMVASYRRTLAPGVFWNANVIYQNTESEENNNGLVGQTTEFDGWAISTAMVLSF